METRGDCGPLYVVETDDHRRGRRRGVLVQCHQRFGLVRFDLQIGWGWLGLIWFGAVFSRLVRAVLDWSGFIHGDVRLERKSRVWSGFIRVGKGVGQSQREIRESASR